MPFPKHTMVRIKEKFPIKSHKVPGSAHRTYATKLYKIVYILYPNPKLGLSGKSTLQYRKKSYSLTVVVGVVEVF